MDKERMYDEAHSMPPFDLSSLPPFPLLKLSSPLMQSPGPLHQSGPSQLPELERLRLASSEAINVLSCANVLVSIAERIKISPFGDITMTTALKWSRLPLKIG